MREVTRALMMLQDSERRLCASRHTLAVSRNRLAGNDRVVESLTARHQIDPQDVVNPDFARIVRSALLIERAEARVWLAEQRLKVGEELMELSRLRVDRRVA